MINDRTTVYLSYYRLGIKFLYDGTYYIIVGLRLIIGTLILGIVVKVFSIAVGVLFSDLIARLYCPNQKGLFRQFNKKRAVSF